MSERILIEPHAHTKETSACGFVPAADLIRQLAAAGYAGVVITDHFIAAERTDTASREAFLAGYRAAKAAGDAAGLIVLPGVEIRLRDQKEEFLVYGMEEPDILALPESIGEIRLSDLHELAVPNGWRIYQAHPFRPGHHPAHTAFIDGLEVFNGNPRHDSQNRLAAKFATMHQLHTIAGSDAHRDGDVGIAGLYVPRDAFSPKAFAAWLHQTPHPRIHYQEPPEGPIRYLAGAIPGQRMLQALYEDAGWTGYTADMKSSMAGVNGSARVVTAWDDTTLVGMARAITDGHTIVYVQDLLVMGTFRRRGIGRGLLRRLLLPYRDVRQMAVLCDNMPEIRAFYGAAGFEEASRIGCTGFLRMR